MSTPSRGVSRRRFLKGMGASAVGAAAASSAAILPVVADPVTAAPGGGEGADTIPVSLNINGMAHQLNLEPRTTLADTLRYHLGLTGAKVVCDRGACGACTVIADGKNIYSCMMLAADAQGKKIRTVEGLSSGGKMSPLQSAFVERDAMMCGFCTPGFVMSCTALLERTPHPTVDEVREAVRGNLCRCGTYPHIFEACLDATGARKKGDGHAS